MPARDMAAYMRDHRARQKAERGRERGYRFSHEAIGRPFDASGGD